MLAAAGAALAQPADDQKRAKEQFEAGQAAVQSGDLKRARTLFRSSYELGHSAGPMLNLADCEERLGLLASARQHFRDAVPLLPVGDPRIAYAEQRAAALDARVALLRVDPPKNLPAGARVLLDEGELPEAKRGTDIPLDAGSHTVTVAAPGHEDWSRVVKLVDAQRTVLVVEVGKPRSGMPAGSAVPPAVPAPVEPGPAAAAPASESRGPWRTAGWAVGAVGLGGVVVGAVLGGLAVAQADIVRAQCGEGIDPRFPQDDTRCTREGLDAVFTGRSLGQGATVALAAGGSLAVLGLVLVVTAPSPAERKPANAAGERRSRWISAGVLSAGPGGVSLGVKGAF